MFATKKGTKADPENLGWKGFDPRDLVKYFERNGITTWLDINEITTSGSLYAHITNGLNVCSTMVACVSDEYVKSENCVLEFLFAHESLKLPIVKAVVGTGNQWRTTHRVGFLAGNYQEVNFQLENPSAHHLQKIIFI